jgi:hypothetical protein
VTDEPSTEMTFPVTEPCTGEAAAAGAVSAATTRQQLTSVRFVITPGRSIGPAPGQAKPYPNERPGQAACNPAGMTGRRR